MNFSPEYTDASYSVFGSLREKIKDDWKYSIKMRTIIGVTGHQEEATEDC